jgi:metallo-beta-lactamase family protein
MMTGGRVLHHALRLLPNPDTTLVFVGYQAAGTRGRRILNGEKEVKILGQWVPVRCRIERINSFSAHADWQEIIHWLERMESPPRRVFVTHGEPGASNSMASHIRERFGWDVTVPSYGDKVTIE